MLYIYMCFVCFHSSGGAVDHKTSKILVFKKVGWCNISLLEDVLNFKNTIGIYYRMYVIILCIVEKTQRSMTKWLEKIFSKSHIILYRILPLNFKQNFLDTYVDNQKWLCFMFVRGSLVEYWKTFLKQHCELKFLMFFKIFFCRVIDNAYLCLCKSLS